AIISFSTLIRLPILPPIIKHPLLHTPIMLLLPRDHKIRRRQQGLHLKHLICLAERSWGLAISEPAAKQLVEHGTLSRLGEIERLLQLYAVLTVIGNPQLRGFRTHRDPGTTNLPGILQFQGIPKLIIRINNRLMTVPAVTGRNVILTTAVRALLEPKTVIALLRMALLHDRFIPLRRLQQPL